jgi:BlaI family penicillinase repressor
MKAVWPRHPVTARDVVDALADETTWKPKTIHTLLSRLVQKGYLTTEKRGREYLFQPTVSEGECRRAASRSFLEKVFDGQIAPFLSCFLEHEQLSREELAELRDLLNRQSE